ncbi:hypothetical protein LTR56_015834 [Elasticomyces elasticus]|nr:hypothetical protein LTR22_023033 [Elasticomyces elasticus]KAK3633419.1 hypothetical protein LTR56_015834 [Elasticomyces elasticus]KAK4922040.1 hypothetical protein LTR49_010626 [Elasticomyces elasticus]KAK5747808.1 hypothetical protein LTS12_022163 [Elasticomyces elasticus]
MSYGRNVTYPVRGTWAQGYDEDHGEAYEWDADEEYLLPTGFDQRSNRYEAFGGWDSRNPGMIDPGTGSRWQRTTGAPYGVDRENDRVRAMVDSDDLDRWAGRPGHTRDGPSHTRWNNFNRPANTNHCPRFRDPYEEAAAGATRHGEWTGPSASQFGIIDLNRRVVDGETGILTFPDITVSHGYYLNGRDYSGSMDGAYYGGGRRSGPWDTSEDQWNMSMPRSSLDFYDPEF